jgi:2'-5' RNA ligase
VRATESALIVPVPEAEPVVAPYREALDRAAAWGVPAHVTVLYPFLPPEELTSEVLAAVREVVAAVPPSDVVFDAVRWFGDGVVWLDPSPSGVFRRLTLALWNRFPQAPPYAGEHGDDVTPHLTVGHDAPVETLRAAADAVAGMLPVHAGVRAVDLVAGSREPGSWRTLATFDLAPGSG